jgi:hypothetical protein
VETATEATNFQYKLRENHDLTAQPVIACIYLCEHGGMHPVCITFKMYCKGPESEMKCKIVLEPIYYICI